MRIIRAPRQGHFTIVPNETARDRDLTYRALGLLVELLSHEDGWETSADRIAARAQEGRAAIRTVLTELEDHHYLKRQKERTVQGRYEWTWFIYDVPQRGNVDPDIPPTRPVDNPADRASTPPVDKIPSGSADQSASHGTSQNRRSEPESKNPPVVQPPMDDPPLDHSPTESPSLANSPLADQSPVSQQSGNGLHKKPLSQNTITNTPPPKPPAPDATAAAPGPNPEVAELIEDVIRRLPDAVRPRSKGQREAFAEALTPYLLTGWTPEVIAARAGYEPIPERVHSPAGFLRQRLATLRVEAAATPRTLPWCGQCDQTNRWREHAETGQPYKCPECHPSLA